MAEEAPNPPEASATGTSEEPTALEQALACVGAKLDELGGALAGRVDGVLVDAVDGTPTWLVIRLGRFGRRAAVPADTVVAGVGHVWAPYPRDTIRGATNPDPSEGLSCAEERELLEHFGISKTKGRRAALAGREAEAPGSVPG